MNHELHLVTVTAPHFCASVVCRDYKVVRTAPILKYMKGWGLKSIERYCKRKMWGYHCERTKSYGGPN